jgi:hypothetical protein
LRWQNGKADAATIRPDFAGEYRLRAPSGQQIRSVAGGSNLPLRTNPDGSIGVTLEARRSYRLTFA